MALRFANHSVLFAVIFTRCRVVCRLQLQPDEAKQVINFSSGINKVLLNGRLLYERIVPTAGGTFVSTEPFLVVMIPVPDMIRSSCFVLLRQESCVLEPWKTAKKSHKSLREEWTQRLEPSLLQAWVLTLLEVQSRNISQVHFNMSREQRAPWKMPFMVFTCTPNRLEVTDWDNSYTSVICQHITQRGHWFSIYFSTREAKVWQTLKVGPWWCV